MRTLEDFEWEERARNTRRMYGSFAGRTCERCGYRHLADDPGFERAIAPWLIEDGCCPRCTPSHVEGSYFAGYYHDRADTLYRHAESVAPGVVSKTDAANLEASAHSFLHDRYSNGNGLRVVTLLGQNPWLATDHFVVPKRALLRLTFVEETSQHALRRLRGVVVMEQPFPWILAWDGEGPPPAIAARKQEKTHG
jgi:hypothetical protein